MIAFVLLEFLATHLQRSHVRGMIWMLTLVYASYAIRLSGAAWRTAHVQTLRDFFERRSGVARNI